MYMYLHIVSCILQFGVSALDRLNVPRSNSLDLASLIFWMYHDVNCNSLELAIYIVPLIFWISCRCIYLECECYYCFTWNHINTFGSVMFLKFIFIMNRKFKFSMFFYTIICILLLEWLCRHCLWFFIGYTLYERIRN